MSSRSKTVLWILLFSTATFALAAIGFQLRTLEQPPLEKFKPVPDFHLTDQRAKTVALSDLKGKVWLADFIYTTCPGPCPMISHRLSDLQKEALKNPDVRFVSISTDPAHDTPEVLQKYAELFHASDRWLFLTGEKAKVQDLIRNGFSLAIADQDDPKNPVVHSTKLVLVDKDGVIRKYFDGQSDENNAEILHDISRLVRE